MVAQAAQLWRPDGYLFLGASETLWQIQDELEAVDLGSCFGYRHRPPGASRRLRLGGRCHATRKGDRGRVLGGFSAAGREARGGRRGWNRTGEPCRDRGRGSERALGGAAGRAASAGSAVPAGPARAPGGGEAGREPMRRSRPPRPSVVGIEDRPAAGAEPAPPTPAGGVQEKLLRAARLLAGNEVAAARGLLGEVLAADPSEPAAHALEGFLHDLGGSADEALASYRAALYLEPDLYQARLLLADCLLRRGHRDQAEHQYREVLATLAGGRERTLTALEDLPLPDPERARRRCRQVLGKR